MNDNFHYDDSPGHDTGPQGTRVFRRRDIARHVGDCDREAGAAEMAAPGAVLVGVNGAYKDRRIGVPAGRSTLGRDVTNNIIVTDDSVSLVHARLVQKDGEWRVLNLLSTNGTWVNNRKVSDAALKDGDTVCFGQAEFVFHNTGERRAAGLWNRLRRWLHGGP